MYVCIDPTRCPPEGFSAASRPHVGVIKFRDRVEIRLCDLPGEGFWGSRSSGLRALGVRG